jgi:hypothetical protein
MSIEAIGVLIALLSLTASVISVHTQLNTQLSDAMMREVDDADLLGLWDPVDPDRLAVLTEAHQEDALSGAWNKMTERERKFYRYSRRVLDILEQAHIARNQSLIEPAQWPKWDAAVSAWSRVPWTQFVVDATDDTAARYTPQFVTLVAEKRS